MTAERTLTDELAAFAIGERFAALIDVYDDGCWLWRGDINNQGYGALWLNGKHRSAHRIAYEMLKGEIPDGLVLDHLCRVRHCVNPAHLEAVTNTENIRRGEGDPAQKARRTHCANGHELGGENVYLRPGEKPNRRCKTCQYTDARRRQDIRRAAVRDLKRASRAAAQSTGNPEREG